MPANQSKAPFTYFPIELEFEFSFWIINPIPTYEFSSPISVHKEGRKEGSKVNKTRQAKEGGSASQVVVRVSIYRLSRVERDEHEHDGQ